MLSLTLSALAHAAVLVALWGLAGFWSQSSKVYVVNLVSSISAVGSPEARVAPAQRTTGRPVAEPQRPAAEGAAKQKAKQELARKQPPPEPKLPELAHSESSASRSVALPKLDGKQPSVREPKVNAASTLKELPAAAAKPELPPLRKPVLPAPKLADIRRVEPRTPIRPQPMAKEEAPLVDAKEPAAATTLSRAEPSPAPPRAEPASVPAPRAPGLAVAAGRPSGSVHSTASLSLDVSDFPHAWYLRQILQKVEDSWTRQAKVSEPEQKPLVYVEIQRDGSITPPKIEKSSGNVFYDQAALRAILESSPFPPLPSEWPKPSLRVLFRFELQVERG